MQGVVQAYDPASRTGVVLSEPGRDPVALRPASLAGGVFRVLRPGQRILFDVEEEAHGRYAARVGIAPGR